LLCQTAYKTGLQTKNEKLTRLYPDQLNVAFAAYERARQLDKRGRLDNAITLQYYELANQFKSLAREHYQKGAYAKAMTAFENALLVVRSPLVSAELDTALVYNTAIAAYEARNWEKAVEYFTGLNDMQYGPDAALLLHQSLLQTQDTATAEAVLQEGVERYNGNESVVLLLADILVKEGREEDALQVLKRAMEIHPENPHFPWTAGLIRHRQEQYTQALEYLLLAESLAPPGNAILYDLGVCYYNMGVEINESARSISDNRKYREAKAQEDERFRQALTYLERAYEEDPDDQAVISQLYQLYRSLNMVNKHRSMKLLLDPSEF
jgi:tetratricopeptide (TPR) repeat protein